MADLCVSVFCTAAYAGMFGVSPVCHLTFIRTRIFSAKNRAAPRWCGLTMMPVVPLSRDCLDCGGKDAMKLQNTAHTAPVNIPLLYVCQRCGAHLTIPPPPLNLA